MPVRLRRGVCRRSQNHASSRITAFAEGISDVSDIIRDHTVEKNNERYAGIDIVGRYLANLFPQHGTIMTQCFAETIVGQILKRGAKTSGQRYKDLLPGDETILSRNPADRVGLP